MLATLLISLLNVAEASPVPRSLPSSYITPSFGQSQSNILSYVGDSLHSLVKGVQPDGFFSGAKGQVGGWAGQNGWTVVAQYDRAFGTQTYATNFHDAQYTLSTTSGQNCDWDTPFADCFNDDNGWTSLSLLYGYDAYGNSHTWTGLHNCTRSFTITHGLVRQQDLNAGTFTQDSWITGGLPQTCGGKSLLGGVTEQSNTTNPADGTQEDNGLNAISTGLFALQAAELCGRTGDHSYCDQAVVSLNFIDQQLLNSNNLIIDHVLIPSCQYQTSWVFSYNTGVYIGAYARLGHILGNQNYINKAKAAAQAAMGSSAPWNGNNGIIDANQGTDFNAIGDGTQFQGILIRNLVDSYPFFDSSTQADILEYLKIQYYGLSQLDANSNTHPIDYALQWQGPSYDPNVQTAETQIVAISVLNGLKLFPSSAFPSTSATNVPVAHL